MDTETNTGPAIPKLADLLNDVSLDRETELLLKEIRAEIKYAESSIGFCNSLPDFIWKVYPGEDEKLGSHERFSGSIIEEKQLMKKGVYFVVDILACVVLKL